MAHLRSNGIIAAAAAGIAFGTAWGPGLSAQGAPGAGNGRIEGVATISPRLTTPRLRVRVYDEPGTPPPKAVPDEHPLASVVIYLEPVEKGGLAGVQAAPRPAPALRQHNERFAPHVVAVMAGSTVDFPNDDAVFHNVFSLSGAKAFDLGRYPQGSSKSVTFPKPGVVQVFCHIHADMSGYVLVLDNPFFVVPDANGHFALDGVPPGEYRLTTWHERIKPMVSTIRVQAGRTTTVPLRIPLSDAPQSP